MSASYASRILAVERIGVLSRYAAFFVLAPLFLLGYLDGSGRDFVILTAFVLFHNAYAHYGLLTASERWFRSPLNLAIYLAEGAVAVGLTGGEDSAAFVLFMFVTAGFSIYSRRMRRALAVTGLCCLCYAAAIGVEAFAVSSAFHVGRGAARLFSIAVAGWVAGQMSQLLGDIEESHRNRSRELAYSEAMLRATLDSAADPIVVLDAGLAIADVNEPACKYLRLPRASLRNQPLGAFLLNDGALAGRLALLRSKSGSAGEEVLVDATGEQHPVKMTVQSFVRDGKEYFVAVFHDLSEQKQLREAVQHAEQRLERLAHEVRQVDVLKAASVVALSKRLRSPLTAILGYLEMLLEEELGELKPEQRNALQTCQRSARRLVRVMDEALESAGPALLLNGTAHSTRDNETAQGNTGLPTTSIPDGTAP